MIDIKDLSYYYKKKDLILERINTTLMPGQIYGLLGLNGEGKTTLLKLISSLLFPKIGSIRVNALDSTSRSKAFLENIYLLTDQPTDSSLRIDEYVKIYHPFYKNFSKQMFDEMMQDFNLEMTAPIKGLSHGQKKKFYLAFALAANTKYLLLDEPTNGMDIPSKAVVRKHLAKSITEDKTFLIATHLVKDIENLIDHLLILREGSLVLDKSVAAIQHEYRFVQSPRALEQALYQEHAFPIYRSIMLNETDDESQIDIELLFNAIQQNKI